MMFGFKSLHHQVCLIPTFRKNATSVLRVTDGLKFAWILTAFQHPPEPNSATMKMEVVRYFETSEQLKYTTWWKPPK